MRTLAIINQKGGCGKTTTSINLAAVLAQRGQRTLLVDMDPQSHCALGLAVPEAQVQRSTADLMRAGLDGSLGVQDVTWQIARNFDLAPSSMTLAAIEAQLSGASDKDRRLAQVLSTVDDKYDFCIIDCPPSIGLLTFNALRASREVIVPVETGFFSMQGSVKQQKTIEMLAERAGHHVDFMILPTMYDVRTKLARELLSEIRKQFGDFVLPMVINFNSKLKEAASFGQPITEYDDTSRGMQDFEVLAQHLIANPPKVPNYGSSYASTSNGYASNGNGMAMAGASANGMNGNGISSNGNSSNGISSNSHGHTVNYATNPNGQATPSPTPPSTHGRAPAHGQTQPATPPQTATANGALSRAAELVERARALSARTAEISSRIPDQPADELPVVNNLTAPTDGEPSPLVPVPSQTNGTTNTKQLDIQITDSEERLDQLGKVFGVKKTATGVLFVQPINADTVSVQRMAIAGDFNNWNPSQTPLERNEQLGVWQAVVSDVPPGRYRYRLVVDNDWTQDPYNETVETNPYGELNNVLEVN